ncbi:hypothetical protein [Paenibacillus prosopidis]|uniref:PH (Pleckstrin Homology) domain-containing protein n=1 Tax=Paenibacillus prosopidis TaxID=630520 RepID=A0A368W5E1_9BACL|nr:hypothetical protein [Paenibacillus prosopidis]RCW50973.1 hypothetical protein DFP97_102165 [Paenibacillus prosopidis]
MSRSWERKVRKNMGVVNKQRKKQGNGQIVLNAEKSEKIVGRNFIVPILLILFICLYVVLMQSSTEFQMDTMFWVTIGCYILLAALFYFRRPYITIGKDYVQTRRFTGDKRLPVSAIKGISVQAGYVIIEQHKGGNWVFSKLTNRFPTEIIGEKLKQFAQANGIAFQQK